MQRKSVYSQMQQQIASMEEQMKDNQGTIETLERQLVQAGIKDKINEGAKVVDKSVMESQGQQKLLQGRMKDALDLAKKELALEKNQNPSKSVDK